MHDLADLQRQRRRRYRDCTERGHRRLKRVIQLSQSMLALRFRGTLCQSSSHTALLPRLRLCVASSYSVHLRSRWKPCHCVSIDISDKAQLALVVRLLRTNELDTRTVGVTSRRQVRPCRMHDLADLQRQRRRRYRDCTERGHRRLKRVIQLSQSMLALRFRGTLCQSSSHTALLPRLRLCVASSYSVHLRSRWKPCHCVSIDISDKAQLALVVRLLRTNELDTRTVGVTSCLLLSLRSGRPPLPRSFTAHASCDADVRDSQAPQTTAFGRPRGISAFVQTDRT